MKKRLIAVFLALSMVATLIVSCGDDQKTSSQNSGSSSTSSNTEDEEIVTEITLPITEEKVTFTEWRPWSNDWMTNYGEVRGIQKIEELTNVRVEYICVPNTAATEKFGLLLASGEYPNMVESSGPTLMYPGGLDAGVADGVLVDMTEYVRKYMPNYRALLEEYEDIKRISISDEGRNVGIYMIRCYVDGPNQEVVIENEPAWCGMTVRLDWLEELNMEVPRTIDELHEVLVAFRDNYGAWMHLYKDGTIGNDYILSAYGVTQDFYMVDDSTVGFGPITEEYKTYLKLMRDWYAEGLIDPDFTSTNSTNILTDNEYFANDKCGVGMSYQGTCGNMHYMNGYTANEKMWLEPIEGPVLNEGDTTVTTFQSTVATSPNIIFNSVTEEQLPILAKFLDWHYTYDYAVIQSFGVEGESYVIDESNDWYFVYTDDVKYPTTPGMTPGARRGMYGLFNNVGYMNWKAGFELSEFTGNTYSALAYEVWGRQTDEIMVPAASSFTTDEASEYNNLFVDIETYVEENTVQFIMGTVDIDAGWDNYVAGVKSLNVDRCIELKQASVDRYYAKTWLLEQE